MESYFELTKVVFRHTVRRIRFVQNRDVFIPNSSSQTHSQWNLISSNQEYVGSSRLQTQTVECEQLKPEQEHAHFQVTSDTATGASVIEPSAGWTLRHHALHIPYTGGQQERVFLKTREVKEEEKHHLSTEI